VRYIPGPLPIDATAWIVRELQTISQASDAPSPFVPLQELHKEPIRPRDGMIAVADGTDWDPNSGAGLYFFQAGAWHMLSGGGGGSGTVTSVAQTVPAFLSVAGSPVVNAGTLAITLSGTALPVTSGGTSLTTLTANNVILGNGTSAPQFVAPSTSGYVLTSNGTTWQSSALPAATPTSVGRHAIWIVAGSMSPSAAGGCAALATIASGANLPDIQSLDFDATTEEYAQFRIRMPKSWDEGTVTFVPVWSHAATATNFGVVWSLQAVAVSNDDTIAVAFGTAQTSTDTGGTTDDLYAGPESSAITVAGTPAAEDVVCFRVFRTPGNGSDTMAIDARLIGVTVYITTDAGTDA
jgi:hypothetical protein